jgi:hypothetical protein
MFVNANHVRPPISHMVSVNKHNVIHMNKLKAHPQFNFLKIKMMGLFDRPITK